MMWIIYLYLFITGACFGSFINVIAYRLPRNESMIKERSYCEYCHHQLCWYELIPVFSYIFLKGKCRYCQKGISIKHLIIECMSGLLFILCFHRFGFSLQTVIIFFICLDLLVIAIIDQQTMDIYLVTVIVFLFLSLINRYYQGFQLKDMSIGALSVSLPMLLINVFIPKSFGWGDIEIVFVSGILLGGFYNLLAISISILAAGIEAFYLLLIKKANRKEYIPFGPFLVLGIFISLFFGTKILMCYLRMFFTFYSYILF